MKKCSFCDWENEDDAKECLACGNPLKAAVVATGDGLYSVVIEDIGGNKIAVIKEIKEYLNCGLAEAKEKCEKGYVCGGVSEMEAQELIERLQNVGATAKAVTGEVDPSTIDAPTVQGGSANGASPVNNKAMIIGAVVAGIIFFFIFLAIFL